MTNKTAVLGFPRIGEKRELKIALESYWKGNISLNELNSIASELRLKHWNLQHSAGIKPPTKYLNYAIISAWKKEMQEH
jgi:5-methyltetrahydropteroyltriglutamate--homocysteine methyltransferase